MVVGVYRVARWLCWSAAALLAVLALTAGIAESNWSLAAKAALPVSLLVGLAGFCGRQAARLRRRQQGQAAVPPPTAVAPAPPPVYTGPPVANPCRRTVRGLGITVALCLGVPLLLTPLVSGAPLGLLWLLGGSGAALCGLILVLAQHSGRRQVEQIQGLLAGDSWVHWQYTSAEWERFVATGWGQRRRTAARICLAVGAGAAALSLLVVLAAGDVLATAVVLGAGLLITAVIWWVFRLHARRSFSGQYRQVLIGPAGAYLIGADGALAPGRFHQWQGWGLELQRAELQAGDPWVLELELGMTGAASHEICLPVPRGHETEARILVDRLREESA